MDLASLDRLFCQARGLSSRTEDPLLRLYYWATALRIFLDSGIAAPVYRREAEANVIEVLVQSGHLLQDGSFLSELRCLVDHRNLPTESRRALSNAIRAASPSGRSDTPALARHGSELGMPILLVLQGPTLWGCRPSLGVQAWLRVFAFQGHHPPGRITWRNRLQPDSSIQRVAEDALQAALNMLGSGAAKLSYLVEVVDHRAALTGGSLGLPLAILFHAYESAERRLACRIPRSSYAYTGAIDRAGSVRSIASEALRGKVSAAVGAGLAGVVLPEGNVLEARKALDDGLARGEGSGLKLLGVSSLSEALDDSRVVSAPQTSVRRAIRRTRKGKVMHLTGLAIVLVALGLLLWPHRWDPDQTSVEIRGEDRLDVVTRIAGFPSRERTWHFDSPVCEAQVVRFHPADDPVLLVATFDTGGHPAHLFCKEMGSRRTRWVKGYAQRFPLPDSIAALNEIRAVDFEMIDLDANGRKDVILILAAVPQSPCFVAWIDEHGRERAYYAHRGYLFLPQAADLNHDGFPEVYLAGTSNGDQRYGQRATIVTLDRYHFRAWPGDGPFRGSCILPFDSCLARVIFPAIDEHCRLDGVPGYAVQDFRISETPDPPTIQVWIWTTKSPGLIITLDEGLHPLRVIPQEALLPTVWNALDRERISVDFTSVENMREYLHQIVRLPLAD